MGAVDLDDVKPGLDGPLGRGGEGLDQLPDLRARHLADPRVRAREGHGARPPHVVGPPADVKPRDVRLPALAVPGREGARLAARVGELHPRAVALRVHEVDDAAQRRDVAVAPEARVLGRDAPVGEHGGGLDDDEGGAARRQRAEVREVPVGEVAAVGRVLAHGRHDEAVGQRHAADRERLEEGRDLVLLLLLVRVQQAEGRPGGGLLRRRVERHAWRRLAGGGLVEGAHAVGVWGISRQRRGLWGFTEDVEVFEREQSSSEFQSCIYIGVYRTSRWV